jgi:Mrp family chromosome partitioning ATPase
LKVILTNIQEQASQVVELEPKIAEVQRRRDEEQKTYEFTLKRLERIQNGVSAANGEANSISIVQSPTQPYLDSKKTLKMATIVFAVCAGLGVGLAFLLDLVLDRSIKRPVDVERHLRLPVFLTIPDTTWTRRLGLAKWGAKAQPKAASNDNTTAEVALWEPGHQLHGYVEGLRERLVTYFEVNNLNLKKPKLVAVTGCEEGAGVSTLATGLAATLSKTGDGNVLLVDMNGDKGIAHSFYQGKPGCGLSNALEPDARAGAQVQENLYLASLQDGPNHPLAKAIAPRFSHLMPKLKASDYDYIIFDMPPVVPGSATPRLGSYMDIVLLVLEAERTGQHSAACAGALMRESRANVAAVLNKHRSHVPAGMAHDS